MWCCVGSAIAERTLYAFEATAEKAESRLASLVEPGLHPLQHGVRPLLLEAI
jgi:hypothetical protein